MTIEEAAQTIKGGHIWNVRPLDDSTYSYDCEHDGCEAEATHELTRRNHDDDCNDSLFVCAAHVADTQEGGTA